MTEKEELLLDLDHVNRVIDHFKKCLDRKVPDHELMEFATKELVRSIESYTKYKQALEAMLLKLTEEN
jgi:hypothetical protein